MLKIEITDPHQLPVQTLIDTAAYLLRLAGEELKYLRAPNPTPNCHDSEPLASKDAVDDIVAKQETLMGTGIPPTFDPVYEIPQSLTPEAVPPFVTPEQIMGINPTLAAPVQVMGIDPGGQDKSVEAVVRNPFAKPTTNGGVEVDINGLPWDARIHSRTKTKTLNGAWKLQRGVSMVTVGQVTKELEAVMSIPQASGCKAPPAPPVIPQPPVTQPAADPIEPPKETFNTLMNKITDLVSKGKVNQGMVVRACQSVGIPSLPLVGTRPDLIPQISAAIDAMVLAS